VIYRRGILKVLVTDDGLENKKVYDLLLLRYNIRYIVTTTYNPPTADIIERDYNPIINALSKIIEDSKTDWPRILYLVLLADRTSVKRITRRTLFELIYNEQYILSIKVKVGSWRILS
jgi:hypothetical protein